MVEPLPDWAPVDLDLTVPSAARMYDYYLGGAHNFAVDRELANQVLKVIPDGPRHMQANRAFLHRAVRYLLGQGIRQFIDIGSGIPTVGNMHETVLAQAPEAKVLYVDHLRRPAEILDFAQRGQFIDLSAPVAVLMVAVLRSVPETDQPNDAIRVIQERVAPGSCLVISHATADGRTTTAEEAADLYRNAADSMSLRPSSRIQEFFTGWELVDPGLTWVPEWRPNWPDEVGPDPASSYFYAGVGQKGNASAGGTDRAGVRGTSS